MPDTGVKRTGGGSLRSSLISPLEREEFLTDLAMRAGLARDGERLVREQRRSVR